MGARIDGSEVGGRAWEMGNGDGRTVRSEESELRVREESNAVRSGGRSGERERKEVAEGGSGESGARRTRTWKLRTLHRMARQSLAIDRRIRRDRRPTLAVPRRYSTRSPARPLRHDTTARHKYAQIQSQTKVK